MPDLLTAPINVSGAGSQTVIAGVSGQIIQVIALYFQCNIASVLTIKTGNTSHTGSMSFLASGGLNLPATTTGHVYFQSAEGESFIFHFSGLLGQAGGQILYYQFDPTP
jgi:hypothetical protein